MKAGFISVAGKITEVLDHRITAGSPYRLTQRLKTNIRFRVFNEQQLVFETLAKKITGEQKTVLDKYIKQYKDYYIACSIAREYIEANGFTDLKSLRLLRQFINCRTV